MITQVIIEALAAAQPVIGAVYYWRKQGSTRESVRELRRQGLTLGQLANAFNCSRSTIIKILQESPDTSTIWEDSKLDWSGRLEAWCRANDKHLEDNPFNCHCSKCQARDRVMNQPCRLYDIDDPDYCTGEITCRCRACYSEPTSRCGGCGKRSYGLCSTCRYYEDARQLSASNNDDELGPLR